MPKGPPNIWGILVIWGIWGVAIGISGQRVYR